MTKHSNIYEKKKAELAKAEQELRRSLEGESGDLEQKAIGVLKVAAVVSTGVLIGYGIYRLTRKAEEPTKTPSKVKDGFINKVVDKVTDVVAGLAIQNITTYLDKLKSDVEKEIKR